MNSLDTLYGFLVEMNRNLHTLSPAAIRDLREMAAVLDAMAERRPDPRGTGPTRHVFSRIVVVNESVASSSSSAWRRGPAGRRRAGIGPSPGAGSRGRIVSRSAVGLPSARPDGVPVGSAPGVSADAGRLTYGRG